MKQFRFSRNVLVEQTYVESIVLSDTELIELGIDPDTVENADHFDMLEIFEYIEAKHDYSESRLVDEGADVSSYDIEVL
jgi:hypothetical protein